MATLDSAEIVKYYPDRDKLLLKFVVDGVTIRKSYYGAGPDPADHAARLAEASIKVVQRFEDKDAAKITDNLGKDTSDTDWSDMPDGTAEEYDRKRHAARVAVRDAVVLLSDAADEVRRGSKAAAASDHVRAYLVLKKIVQHLQGNAAQRRAYLAVSQAEWTGLVALWNHLNSFSAEYAAFQTQIATTPSVEITTDIPDD